AEAKDRPVGLEQRSATRQHDVETTSRPHAADNGPQAVPALPTLPPVLPGIGNFSDRLRQGSTKRRTGSVPPTPCEGTITCRRRLRNSRSATFISASTTRAGRWPADR